MPRTRWRACPSIGCPNLVAGPGRCQDCAREAEQRRGTAHQRGYDRAHQNTRARLLAALRRDIASGRPAWTCARCGQPMTPDQDLDTGHRTDRSADPNARADRLEHASCNRSAGGALGAAITNAR